MFTRLDEKFEYLVGNLLISQLVSEKWLESELLVKHLSLSGSKLDYFASSDSQTLVYYGVFLSSDLVINVVVGKRTTQRRKRFFYKQDAPPGLSKRSTAVVSGTTVAAVAAVAAAAPVTWRQHADLLLHSTAVLMAIQQYSTILL